MSRNPTHITSAHAWVSVWGVIRKLIFLLILSGVSASVLAHRSYESYLHFDPGSESSLVWEIETNNFESLFTLDDNGNEIISWKEILNHQQTLIDYALQNIEITLDNKGLILNVDHVEVKRRGDQSYLVLVFDLPEESHSERIEILYSLFFYMDKSQRLIFSVGSDKSKDIYLLSPEENQVQVDIKTNNLWFQIRQFVREGILHLFSGYDHLAFLMMLVLAYMGRLASQRKVVLYGLFKVISAFSVAHTLTLFLAVTETVMLSAALVELVIALTVMVTALGNIGGRGQILSWHVAFVFGLIHGFGFANVLSEMELQQSYLIVLLFSFNVGLEIGQLLLISLVLPLLLWLRSFESVYLRFSNVCSMSVFAISVVWVIQRS